MNETITYQWSEKMCKASLSAYYKHKVGRSWILVLGGIVILSVGLFVGYQDQDYSGPLILIIPGVILLARPIIIYFGKRRVYKDAKKLVKDPAVTVTLSDECISVSTSDSSRTIDWKSISEAREVDSFILLFCGKLLVASWPCEAFTQQQIDFIKSKI
jgi:hypothetical protein